MIVKVSIGPPASGVVAPGAAYGDVIVASDEAARGEAGGLAFGMLRLETSPQVRASHCPAVASGEKPVTRELRARSRTSGRRPCLYRAKGVRAQDVPMPGRLTRIAAEACTFTIRRLPDLQDRASATMNFASDLQAAWSGKSPPSGQRYWAFR